LQLEESVIRDTITTVDGAGTTAINSNLGADGLTGPDIIVTRSVISGVYEAGIATSMGKTTVIDSVIRNVKRQLAPIAPCLQIGAGSTTVLVSGSFLQQCTSHAIVAYGADMRIERTTITDVKSQGLTGALLAIGDLSEGGAAHTVVEHSVIRGLTGFGALFGGKSEVTGLVVRDLAGANDPKHGDRAVSIERASKSDDAKLVINGMRVKNVAGVGLFSRGATVEARGASIESVANKAGSAYGMLLVAAPEWKMASSANIADSAVEGIAGAGIALVGASAKIEATRLRAITPPNAMTPARALQVQSWFEPFVTGEATVTRSLIENTRSFGIVAVHGSVSLDRSLIRDVARSDEAGQYGDALTVLTEPSLPGRGTLTLKSTWIQNVPRAGISSFAGESHIETSLFECAAIDLDGEVMDTDRHGKAIAPPLQATFDDRGGNVCVCQGELHPCAVKSSQLSPPVID
jgi:hypothetical protein